MQTHPVDLTVLHARLARAGLPTRPTVRSYAEFFSFVALSVAFLIAALWPAAPIVIRAAAAVAAAWCWSAAAMCGHDAAHGTACRTKAQNTLLGRLSFTLVGGIALSYWMQKHGLHHAHPNVSGKDPDIEHGVFAYSADQHRRQLGIVRWFQRRLNAPAFWVLGSVFIGWEVRVSSIRYLWRTRAPLSEWAWMAAHFLLIFGLPMAILPWKAVVLLHLIGGTLAGAFLVMTLAPGHLADPLVSRTEDPVALQIAVSRNFHAPLGLTWFLNGLHRQIDHHLAPNLNHFDLEVAAPVIERFLAEHGLAYRETGWARALRDVNRHLRRAWRTPEANLALAVNLALSA
jgi:fatty acid desaturase